MKWFIFFILGICICFICSDCSNNKECHKKVITKQSDTTIVIQNYKVIGIIYK